MGIARSPLWRYNYKILVGSGYWVLVLPIAASQVVTMWMMALSSEFSQEIATKIAEMMTPVLGAFLSAHCLAPEYRSGTGTVLASKPVSLFRVVTVRVTLAMLAAVILSSVTLGICSVGLKQIDLLPPLAASVPSLLFLSMLALAFATLFRSAPAGFAAAAGIWAIDLTMGYGANPFLSLQGFNASLDKDPLARVWLQGKVVLCAAGLALLLWHGKLLPQLGRKADRVEITRIVAILAALFAAYCVSGAVAVVGFAYANRGRMYQRDSVWLRRQLKNYGPVPVGALFGPAFMALTAEPAPNGVKAVRVQQLERALARWPGSIWAPSLAMELGQQYEASDPLAAARAYLAVADKYGQSPLAPKALAGVIRLDGEAVPDRLRLEAARRILSDYPTAREVEPAAVTVWKRYPQEVHEAEVLNAALTASKVVPDWARPEWRQTAAEMYEKQGRTAEAAAEARAAISESDRMHQEALVDSNRALELKSRMPQFDAAAQAARSLLQRLGAGN